MEVPSLTSMSLTEKKIKVLNIQTDIMVDLVAFDLGHVRVVLVDQLVSRCQKESNDYKWVELAKASLQVQPVPISIDSALILVYISVCDVPKYLSVT